MAGGPLLRRRSRRNALTGSCLIFFLAILFLHGHLSTKSSEAQSLSSKDNANHEVSDLLRKQQAQSWRAIFAGILNNDPHCKRPPRIVKPAKLDVAYRDDYAPQRPDLLSMHDADVKLMREAHSNFVEQITSSDLHLTYTPNTRGIVMTVSDTQIPVLLVSLHMLRATGSNLSVEAFLWQETPYTTKLCDTILPSMNAKCVFLHDIFREASTGVPLESYQHKIFAILFSSYEEILLLDSDAWPTSDPDELFTSPPFTDTGLVLWPDFWYPSESPHYFTIANIKPPSLADRAATEAGELMYSKRKHEKSIILAAYYNYFGPEYYYPLQSQGAPGQGDKETFGLAALALNESFYAVKTNVIALGRKDSSGEFLGSAMVQHDPRIDLLHRERRPIPEEKEISSKLTLSRSSSPTSTSSTSRPPSPPTTTRGVAAASSPAPHQNSPALIVQAAQQFTDPDTILHPAKPQFIHANYPKFDPRTIFTDSVGGAHTPTRDTNGTLVRCWDISPSVAQTRFGVDIEARLWRAIRTVACHDLLDQNEGGEGLDLVDGGKPSTLKERQVCARVQKYVDTIFALL